MKAGIPPRVGPPTKPQAVTSTAAPEWWRELPHVEVHVDLRSLASDLWRIDGSDIHLVQPIHNSHQLAA